MKLILNLITALLIFCTNMSFAENLVLISDIDDTIKITGIGSYKEPNCSTLQAPVNLFNKGFALTETTFQSRSFYGLNTLYQSFKRTPSKNNQRDIHYVSGSPGAIINLAKLFLRQYCYPDFSVCNVHNRSWSSDTPSFKINKISEIIFNSEANTKFILIGDNGDSDPEIYSEISKRFKNKIKAIFIHNLYISNNPQLYEQKYHQIPFFTAVDIGTHFLSMGLITKKELISIIDDSLETLKLGEHDDEFYRPWMTGCKIFDSNISNSNFDSKISSKVKKFKILFYKKFPSCNQD